MANYMTTTVSTTGTSETTVERYYGSSQTYRDDGDGVLAALLLRTKDGSTAYSLEEARKLAAAVTAIVESVGALRPRKLTFHEQLNAAEVGSTITVKSSGSTYTKIEGGRWKNGSFYPVGVQNFGAPAEHYTLTPPAPTPSFREQLQAAKAGSTVKVSDGGNTYTKGDDGLWRLAGVAYGYKSTDFWGNASDYTLTPPLTWTEKKVNAPVGSKILNKINGIEFIKLATGKWVSMSSGEMYDSVDSFMGRPSIYTLTLADAK